ncbi:MAG TPA: hypothetical protein VFX59_23325 [Polyangiales bacterium]|nr:hypothetical protein [Polyangiales bacterium]
MSDPTSHNALAPTGRKHLVLVPGFVGSDALGQLRYYAGVAQAFQAWRKQAGAEHATLHYFDNFPTASVAQRAARLHLFLADKLALGEINVGDEVTLLGHSTGGLDIRALLTVLRDKPNELAPRNDAATSAGPSDEPLTNRDVRASIRRIVFMSVPHYGTNIADFAARYQKTIQDAITDVLHGLSANRALSSWFGSPADVLQKHASDLVVAIGDALVETDGVTERGLPAAAQRAQEAAEREARFELLLWLEHMQDDFGALLDLRSLTTDLAAELAGAVSPAHYDAPMRARELADWAGRTAGVPGIETLSFANHAAPFALSRASTPLLEAVGALWVQQASRLIGLLAHVLDLFVLPRALLDVSFATGALAVLQGEREVLYALMHRICSHPSGPFTQSTSVAVARAGSIKWKSLLNSQGLDPSSNDGVVNTLSMLWPHDEDEPDPRHQLVFVRADHADIVGLYARIPPPAPLDSGRSHVSYDIFPSQGGFGKAQFDAVWTRVFEFAFLRRVSG